MANESFISKILGLFQGNDPEAEKKKQLRNISKEVNKSKFKFYKPSSSEAQPALGKFFYDLYKLIAPAQSMFNANQNPNLYKAWVYDYVLTEQQMDAIERLDESNIAEQAKTVPLETLTQQVRTDIQQLQASFDASRVEKIDDLYNKLLAFQRFCKFDYYFLLKKFDNTFREGDFNNVPHLEAINGEYIAEDLENFLSIAWNLSVQASDWTDIFALIKQKKGIDPIAVSHWNKLLNRLRDIRTSLILEMMLQLIHGNPSFTVDVSTKTERIADAYLDKIRTEAESKLRSISVEQENSKVDQLLKEIFGTTEVVRLKNYTVQGNEPFTRHHLVGYTYAAPLNYLKAFLLDVVKADVRVFCDIVLVRGEWISNTLSAPMSEAYNSLLEASTNISQFDEKLSEGSELSNKFKNYLPRSERDVEAANVLNTLLNDVNGNARTLIMNALQNIIVMGKNVKVLVEDHEKTRPELLINWKALDHFAEIPIKNQGVDIYKKLYLFINLMQMFLKK